MITSSNRLRNSGRKTFLALLEDAVAHLLVGVLLGGRREADGALFAEGVRADVRGEQDDGVPEVHLPAETVGQFALFENLQEHVHHVRMGLFDLVEEDHAVRLAAHGLGELAALLVADVAGRRADEAGDVELLHVLGHVELHQRLGVAEHLLGQRLGQQRLAHAGGAEQGEGADGAFGVLEVRARAAQGLAQGHHRLLLADDHLGQLLFHLQELAGLVLPHALERDAGPLGHDLHDVLLVHAHALFVAVGFPLREHGLEFFLGLLFLVAHGGGALEVLLPDGPLLAAPDFLDFRLEVFDIRGPGHGADAGARAGLVHDVNGLVRQEATGDVAVGELDRGLEGAVGQLDLDGVPRTSDAGRAGSEWPPRPRAARP
ncbi:MAG: hypothetical protein KatS3mg102_0243 [Planctomycetota bacterium]|nr:MAG: hypothetical protein KatS3mg102_0243 [Planctomycetota bacterium]